MNGCVRKALDAIGMLRVASSTVIKNAQRILSPSTFRNSQHNSLTCKANGGTKSSELIKYSQVLDGELVKFLESKLKTKQLYNKAMPAIPAEFPFTIDDDPCRSDCITLTRELDGEKIEVQVHASNHVFAITYRCISLYVSIFKQNGKLLTFNLKPSGDIDSIHVYQSSKRPSFYWTWTSWDIKGSDFESYFLEFLETRGINKSHYEFLRDYMSRRAKLERISNLKGLKKFVEESQGE